MHITSALAACALALLVNADGRTAAVLTGPFQAVVGTAGALFAQTLAHIVFAELGLCGGLALLLAGRFDGSALRLGRTVGHFSGSEILFVIRKAQVVGEDVRSSSKGQKILVRTCKQHGRGQVRPIDRTVDCLSAPPQSAVQRTARHDAAHTIGF